MTRTLWSRRWYDGPELIDTDTDEPYHRSTLAEVDIQLEPRDLWIGVYWQSYPCERELWICPVPCLALHLWWSRWGRLHPVRRRRAA